MKTKIFAFSLIMLLVLGNVFVLIAASEVDQPTWPTSWILADEDKDESESNNDYRDGHYMYYYSDGYYLYFRLECFGLPNFSLEPKSRYKWYIDTDDLHNMAWSGGNVYEAEFLLFVEDTPKPGGDGIGDVYLLPDVDGDGLIDDDWPDYSNTPGPILNKSISDYRIIDYCIDIYILRTEIGNPTNPYFTWSTDQEDPNLDASANERADSYWNEDLSKADLSIVTSDSADPVYPGDSLMYTLQVTNHGPQDAINVSIKNTLPDAVTFINAVPTQSGITGQTVWWNFTSLVVGDSELITIYVAIKNDTTLGVITDIAVAYNDTHDPIFGNNEAREDTMIGLDTDGDGIPDCVDTDDDNDGYSDVNESACDSNPLNASSVPDDFDGDFIPDCVDTDDNNNDNSYTPPRDNPVEDENNALIVSTSAGEPSFGIGNENNTFNASYRPLSQPIITGPSEGYIDIVYNFSIILNDSYIDIKFIINWGDGIINESDYLAAGSLFTIQHKWIQSGQYNITVTAFDDQTNATKNKAIKIFTPNTPGLITPESHNFWLILFAFLVLIWILLFLLFGRRKDEEKEDIN